MDLTAFVDVAIGLTVVYLGVSLLVTILNEYVAQVFQLRGRQLARDAQRLISDPALRARLGAYPALAPFFDGTRRRSSYIDPAVLARLVLAGIRGAPAAAQGLRDTIATIADPALREQLLAIHDEVGGEVEKFVAGVASWAERSLTMMGELFKRKMQVISLIVGVGVAAICNVDTFALVDHLYRDKGTRALVAELGERMVAEVPPGQLDACLGEHAEGAGCEAVQALVGAMRGENDVLGRLPLGWEKPEQALCEIVVPSGVAWWVRWLGWLATGLSVSLGASFWFDVLSKLVNVRHSMKKPELEAPSA